MIIGVFGDPRAGKSNHVMEHFVIDALKNGIDVFCNIEGVNIYAIQQLYGTKEKPIETSKYHPIPSDCWNPWEIEPDLDARRMIVLDEVQNLYSSDIFKTHPERRRELQKYLTTHGHRGDSVVWLCPNPDQVDANFRRLAEHWLYVRKLNFMPKMLGGGAHKYVVQQSKQYTRKGPFLRRDSYVYNPLTQLTYRSRDVGREEIKTSADGVSASTFKIIWPVLIVLICLLSAGGFFLNSHLDKKKQIEQIKNPENEKNVEKVSNDATHSITANGWFTDENGDCVDWLRESSVVASTCPAPSRYAGKIPATYPNGESVNVELVPGAVPRQAESGEGDGMEDKSPGNANGSSAVGFGSLSLTGKP